MRFVLVMVTAACGRLGFDPGTPGDAADAAIVDTSLVAHYPMEQVANGTPDTTGRGHDLVCEVDDCPALIAGRELDDHAVKFTAPAQRLHTATGAPDLVTTGGFTVAAWFALADTPTDRACIATKLLGTGHFNSWALCIEATRQLLFYSVTGTTEDLMFTNVTVAALAWHHAAIVWDGATKSVWLDGTMVMAHEAAIDFDDGAVQIGTDVDNGSPIAAFPGSIDEVRIYRRALSATELQALVRDD